MLLTINANNTNTKFAIYDGKRFLSDWRIKTDPGRTADQYIVWLKQLMELLGKGRDSITGVIIATVVPQTLFHLQMLCERHLSTRPLIVGDPQLKLDIEILLDRPQEVGADRIANAIGGFVRYRSPLIVVDFGTATTFDVVDGKGNYAGGIIAPGINLSLEALHVSTAMLPRIAVEKPKRVIGKDTLSAMQSGIFFGYIGLIEGLIDRIRKEHKESLEVVATGGLAPIFHGATDSIQHLDPEITMRGLVEIYQRNSKSAR